MKRKHKYFGLGTRIIAGFLAILALMASFAVISLRHISETNGRLKGIVENNNVKTELATSMQAALRERALSMHALSILADPFEKDTEVLRFNTLGATYAEARQRLEQMPLSQEERDILDRIRGLTRLAQPEVQTVVDMAMTDDDASVFDHIRNNAMPKQREIAEETDALIRLQQKLAAIAVRNAELSYIKVRDLMFMLGTTIMLLGLLITWFVSSHANRQAAQLANQALHDQLTGLPNRSLLLDRVEQSIALAERSKRPFAVALMDLNRFKEVNDTLGHDVGDELLREVGRRLKQCVRAEDTVARMGGDEFVFILHDLVEAGVPVLAGKLLAALEAPFHWGNQSIDLDASVGFSLFPSHAKDPGSLIRCADIAMYAAKRSAREYTLYAADQERIGRDALSLKGELREAIQSDQLVLHYQPKIDHRHCCVVGLEALVRWNHPQRGLLGPDKFIPLAEEAALIGPLTLWVLKSALKQLAELHARGYLLTMAVNLSARSLHDLAMPKAISTLLSDSGVEAEYLTLEITESAVMFNPDDALVILGKLDLMGVRLAIDDFGTGYSSLAHLKQLPVDEIKIDKSFVIEMEENENDAVIVRSTIDLAHNLGLKVIAEGVETKDAWDTLTILGCDHSQGYYMSKPLPADRLIEWLEGASSAAMAALQPPRARHPETAS